MGILDCAILHGTVRSQYHRTRTGPYVNPSGLPDHPEQEHPYAVPCRFRAEEWSGSARMTLLAHSALQVRTDGPIQGRRDYPRSVPSKFGQN